MGINFGPHFFSRLDYLEIKKFVAKSGNLYNYPTGEEWPFVIPSTEEEFSKDIKNKKINRNPKFEIVYSTYHSVPLVQLDIETKFNKERLLELIPKPYGISYEGLENVIRTVFILTNWSNVLLRFDLRFKTSGHDFSSWLIGRGGRIR